MLEVVVMMVSPSSPHAVVVAVWPKLSVLYEVVSAPMLMYRLLLVDWMVLPMLKKSPVAAGPRTTREAVRLALVLSSLGFSSLGQ